MTTWLGRYQLLSRRGAGTLGEVFEAKLFGVEGFEKTLAVKRLLPELAAHPAVAEAFAREAQHALRMSHANVVQVVDVGRTDDPATPSWFLAMELVGGVDLGSLLASLREHGRDVPLGLVAFVGAEIAKALDHAHRRRDDKGRPLGLVHGGLGPSNVQLSWEGEVKVGDFGLAKALAAAPESDVVADARRRRAAYVSPEQAAGAAPSARGDLYALGAVLHEMLAGAVKLEGGSTPAGVPDALADVVARLLAADADARPADAGSVHDELLGYAYALGERFGAADLAELLVAVTGGERARPPSRAAANGAEPPRVAGSERGARFVGRTRELGRLGRALAEATRGRARAVTVHGPTGIGTSRLVAEALRRLDKAGSGVGVERAACPSSDVAWSGARAMLAALGEARADQADGEVGATFARAVRGRCAARPCCFVWDDVERLDAQTAGAIAELVAAAGGDLGALFLVASRDPPPDALARCERHDAVALGELDADETALLVADQLGARVVPGELLSHCRAVAGGRPRALAELVRALERRGALAVHEGLAVARLDDAAAPLAPR